MNDECSNELWIPILKTVDQHFRIMGWAYIQWIPYGFERSNLWLTYADVWRCIYFKSGDNQTDEQDCYLEVIQTLFRGLFLLQTIFTIPQQKECIMRVIP